MNQVDRQSRITRLQFTSISKNTGWLKKLGHTFVHLQMNLMAAKKVWIIACRKPVYDHTGLTSTKFSYMTCTELSCPDIVQYSSKCHASNQKDTLINKWNWLSISGHSVWIYSDLKEILTVWKGIRSHFCSPIDLNTGRIFVHCSCAACVLSHKNDVYKAFFSCMSMHVLKMGKYPNRKTLGHQLMNCLIPSDLSIWIYPE